MRGFSGTTLKKGLAFLLLVSSAAVVLPASPVQAASYYIDPTGQTQAHNAAACTGFGGSWDGVSTCTISTNTNLAAGSLVSMEAGSKLLVATSTFTIDGEVDIQGGVLQVDSTGSVVIDSSGTLEDPYSPNAQTGTACAAFGVINYGTVTNSGTISTGCPFYNESGAKLINNAGAFVDALGGEFRNAGTIVNMAGGAFQDDNFASAPQPGMVTNYGTFNNSGYLQLYSGTTIKFAGPSTFSGTFNSITTLNMLQGSTLTVGSAGLGTTLDVNSGTLTIPPTVTLYISQTATLQVDGGASVSDSGYITTQASAAGETGGTINNQGAITNTPGASFTNNGGGNVTNSGQGTITNDGAGSGLAPASVVNAGTFTVSTGSIINQGGSLVNNATGTFTINGGGITDSKGGSVTNLGTMNNNVREGIQNTLGTLTNKDNLTNSGTATITNLSGVVNGPGGLITNHAQSAIDNGISGTFSNTGTLLTFGTMTNEGALTTNGNLTNVGTITNAGQVTNSGSMTSSGTFSNLPRALLVNAAGGRISNPGLISNFGLATLNNNGGSSISNPGTIRNYCGGIVNNAGSLTGNAIISYNPCRTSSTAVTPKPATSSPGATVTFNATVTDTGTGAKVTPTGSVYWTDGKGGGSFSADGLCTLSAAGTCSIAYTVPATGSAFTVNATYVGDSAHLPSSGSSALSSSGTTSTSTSAPEFPAGVLLTLLLVMVVAAALARKLPGYAKIVVSAINGY